jgi:hypothetical protein
MSITDAPVALGETMDETLRLGDTASSSRMGWDEILNCSFGLGACWLWFVISALVAIGVVCGVVIMPIYLDMATSNVVLDHCIIHQCVGHAARVSLVGLGVHNVEVPMSEPCADTLVGERKECFVKTEDVRYGNVSVHFERPYLTTVAVTGFIGWASLLLPLLAWGCRVLLSKRSSPRSKQLVFWIIVGFLVAYGAVAGGIAMPVLIGDMQSSGLIKDTCVVQRCQATNFATVHAELSNLTKRTFLPNCARDLQGNVTCYVGSLGDGVIYTYRPGMAAVIGLGVTGWCLNAIFIGWAMYECATCAWSETDDDDYVDSDYEYRRFWHHSNDSSDSGES